MKIIIFLIIIFFHSFCNAQIIVFDPSGRAEACLVYKNKTSENIYKSLISFVTKYYGTHEEIVTVDSINKSFKINGIMYNALNRKYFPERKPDVSSEYQMEITMAGQAVKFSLQHKKFIAGFNEYYIDFEKLYSNAKGILTYDNEYANYNKQFTGLISSIDHAIKTDTLIHAFGNNI